MSTYEAILRGKELEWIGPSPAAGSAEPLKVQVVVPEPESGKIPEDQAERGKKMREILERIAARGTFAEITDPVAWQREIRRDRPLPGRDDE